MEQLNYGPPSCDKIGRMADLNYQRYVGWEFSQTSIYKAFFCEETVKLISDTVTELLKCSRTDGRKTIVTDKVITGVMFNVYDTYLPQIGNIYTVYIIPQEQMRDDLMTLVRATVQIITSQIKDEIDTLESNRKLNIWDSILGDFNRHGLRQFSTIKTVKDNINKVRFTMNY